MRGEEAIAGGASGAGSGGASTAGTADANGPERRNTNMGTNASSNTDTRSGQPASSDPTPGAAANAVSPPLAAPDASVGSTAQPSHESGVAFSLFAPTVVASAGLLPDPELGLALAAGARVERWSLLLGVGAFRARTLSTDDGAATVEVRRSTADLWLCRGVRAGAFELAPCALLSLEHLTARGEGERVSSRESSATWASVGAGALGRWYLTNWFAAGLGLAGQLEGARPRVTIDGLGEVRKLGPAALTLRLGTEWIF
jgi:hypothetical protein